MTEKRIIKAFEICVHGKCTDCPLKDECESNPFEMTLAVYGNALIQLQKAEIERLKERLNTARADAVREFAEKLKNSIATYEYVAQTNRKKIDVDELRAYMCWMLHDVFLKIVDRVLQKMTEDE